MIWAAGAAASPAGRWIGAATDRGGRVIVAPDLSVPGHPEIFALGDTAAVALPDGGQAPGAAPAAKQMGAYAGRLIVARIAGRAEPGPFRYRDRGMLATIGRNAAVAKIGRAELWGFPAWLLWAALHVFFMIGARNRVFVALSWIWTWTTHDRGARLISGASETPQPAAEVGEPARAA